MAIDSREKRQAAASVNGALKMPGITPSPVRGVRWRQRVGWGYPTVEAPIPLVWLIRGDFDQNGSYEVDLTRRVDAAGGGYSVARGMNSQGVYQVSRVGMTLANRDGELTPDRSASPLFGKVKSGVPVRIRAVASGVTYDVWNGYANLWGHRYRAAAAKYSQTTADDILAFLRDVTVSIAATTMQRTDQALATICNDLGLVDSDYDFDVGMQVLPLHYVAEQDSLEAAQEVVVSEMGGLLWVRSNGKIRFEARNSRLGINVDDTWGDGTDVVPSDVLVEQDSLELVQEVAIQSTVFQTSATGEVALELVREGDSGNAISIPVGEELEIELPYELPISAVIAPVQDTDYKANSAVDGTGSDQSSALGVTSTDRGGVARVKLRNNHSDRIYVTEFQVRGTREARRYDSPMYRWTLPSQKHKTGGGKVAFRLPWTDDS